MAIDVNVPPTNDEMFIERLKIFEGYFRHMYKDTANKVTIGLGIMLANLTQAQSLSYVKRSGGIAATNSDIKVDFDAVTAAAAGMPAASYKPLTKLDATEASLKAEHDVRFARAKQDAKSYYADYDDLVKNYPAVAYAVLDMAYNLGLTKLNQYVNFKAALTAKDWANAATESHRNGIQASRNKAIKAWIESAI